MSVLLDSCVVIDVLRSSAAAIAFVKAQSDRPSISPVTLMELHTGFRSRRDEAEAERLVATLDLLRVDSPDIWRRAGQHMKHYHDSHGLDDLDALIAATAEYHSLKLATLNVKHFPMFKRLKAAY